MSVDGSEPADEEVVAGGAGSTAPEPDAGDPEAADPGLEPGDSDLADAWWAAL